MTNRKRNNKKNMKRRRRRRSKQKNKNAGNKKSHAFQYKIKPSFGFYKDNQSKPNGNTSKRKQMQINGTKSKQMQASSSKQMQAHANKSKQMHATTLAFDDFFMEISTT